MSKRITLFITQVSAVVVLIIIAIGLGFTTIPTATIPTAKAQFVIASWDYPDSYGQGIDGLRFYENSTGSWVAAPYYTDIGSFYYLNYYETSYTLNWSAGVSMKIQVVSVLNTTQVQLTDGQHAEGQNNQKHNISVSYVGEIVFSQQNLTYSDYQWVAGDLIFYDYDVVLNFIPISGAYIITLTYEVYY